jgi:hypothetical protein
VIGIVAARDIIAGMARRQEEEGRP